MFTTLKEIHDNLSQFIPLEMQRDCMRMTDSFLHEIRKREAELLAVQLVQSISKYEPGCTMQTLFTYLPYVSRETSDYNSISFYLQFKGQQRVLLFEIKNHVHITEQTPSTSGQRKWLFESITHFVVTQ